MPFGKEVDVGPGYIVLDGAQLPLSHPKRGTEAPTLWPTLLWPNGRPSQRLLSSSFVMVALWNRADRYIFALWFLSSIYLLFFLA